MTRMMHLGQMLVFLLLRSEPVSPDVPAPDEMEFLEIS